MSAYSIRPRLKEVAAGDGDLASIAAAPGAAANQTEPTGDPTAVVVDLRAADLLCRSGR